MADETDGIEEAFDGQLRIAITAAGRVGEAIARSRESALRQAQARSEREARELASRFEAEQRAARVELGNVYRSDWWDRATPEQIGSAFTTARAWGAEDPEAVRAEGRIRDELRTRYGVSPEELQADVQRRRAEPTFSVYEFHNEADSSRQISKAAALNSIERMPADASLTDSDRGGLHDIKSWIGRDHDVDSAIAAKFLQLMDEAQRAAVDAETQRRRAAAEEAEALALLGEAEGADNAAEAARDGADNAPNKDERERAEAQAEREQNRADATRENAAPLYDSAERREQNANNLERIGVGKEAVSAKMAADVSQAQPARAAVRSQQGKSAKARPNRSRSSRVRRSELGR